MSGDIQFSRPLRWAARVSQQDEIHLKDYLRNVRVAVRMEPDFDHHDAKEAFLLTVNMLLRFCPQVAVVVDARNVSLIRQARALGRAILRSDQAIEVAGEDVTWSAYDSVITVGSRPVDNQCAVTVNSNGWVARIGTGRDVALPWRRSRSNAIGALAAACLGVGTTAAMLLKLSDRDRALELSLFELAAGALGAVEFGPDLPVQGLEIDATVFGCGGVTNGWAYAMRRLPVRGRIEAVDKQSLREENLGPYVLSSWSELNQPKAMLIKKSLEPSIKVTPRPEPLEFYKIRFDQGLVRLPRLIVAGLDDITPRHAVQRLWPAILIDMAGGGTTTQLVVHHAGDDGICLLEALRAPDAGAADFAEVMAAATGISADRIRNNPTDLISEEDVAAAPPEHRDAVEAAWRAGRLVCGRITDHNLHEEGYSSEFAPAAPFVSGFSGVVGAAATIRALMGLSTPLHYQFDFTTLRGRRLQLKRSPECECANTEAYQIR